MSALNYDAAAVGYDRMMGRWSRLWAAALVEAAGVRPGHRVLDLAAGTGEATLAAAVGAGPAGRVVAADLSVPMLRVARAKARGEPVTLAAMDGQRLACRDRTFDAAVCMLGLMFFPDPRRGLEELRRVLRPGGGVAVCVWGPLERSPYPGLVLDVLGRHLPQIKETLDLGFSLGDPARLEQLLGDAGLDHVVVRYECRRVEFADFEDFWAPVEAGGSRASHAYLALPAAARDAVRKDARERLARFETGGRPVFEVDALLAAGRRPR